MPDPGVREEFMPKWDPGKDWWAEIKKLYPGWAKIIEGNEGLKAIIVDHFEQFGKEGAPAAPDWGEMETTLLNLMKNSRWYTTQAKSVRDSIILEAEDPATYKRNLHQNTKDIKQILFNEGLSFTSERITLLAEQAERYDWDLNEMTERLIEIGRSGDKPIRGGIKRSFEDIKSYAQSMLVPIGDGKVWDYAYGIQAGNDSIDNAQDFIQTLAASTFDFVNVQELASQGVTISDLLSSAKQEIAKTLELNENDVRLYDMALDDLVVGEDDSKRFINRQEAESWSKQQGRYQMTDDFRNGVRNLAMGISNTFGTRNFGGYV